MDMLIHDAWVASHTLTSCLHIGHLAAAGQEVDLLHSSQKQLAMGEKELHMTVYLWGVDWTL